MTNWSAEVDKVAHPAESYDFAQVVVARADVLALIRRVERETREATLKEAMAALDALPGDYIEMNRAISRLRALKKEATK